MGASTAIGILAGINELPIVATQKARAAGLRTVVVALFPKNNPELKEVADVFCPIEPSQLGQIIAAFKNEGVSRLVMLGKVTKELLYKDFRPDAHWLSLLSKVKDKRDDSLLLAIVQELASHGLEVLPQTTFLGELVAKPNFYTSRRPSPEEIQEILLGYPQAKTIAGLDIGQTLVLSGGAVMAVEAIEGTNQSILRAGSLARGRITVVKVAKPNQDQRFDIPTIGYDTVDSVVKAGGGVIAVEGGEVFFVSKEEALALAEEYSISICAFNPKAAASGDLERLWEEE